MPDINHPGMPALTRRRFLWSVIAPVIAVMILLLAVMVITWP